MTANISPEIHGQGIDQMDRKGQLIQLSWHDIVITANPPAGRCGKKPVVAV